jgi:hypothetical protein
MHTTTINELTDRAHQIANQFAGEREYAGFADILAELLAGARLVADQMQLDWPSVQRVAKQIYVDHVKAAKAARTPKATRRPIPAASQYRIKIVPPSGETIIDEQPEAYMFAVLQQVDGAWGIRSRVNSRAVALSRCYTFRKAGVLAENLKVVEVFPQPIGDAPAGQLAVEDGASQPTADLTGQNLVFPGSEKVHAPNSEYAGALCGASKGKDARQTEAAVTCKACQRLVTLYTLAAEAAADSQAAPVAE